MADHPVDSALRELLGSIAPPGQEVLRSKIHLLRLQREGAAQSDAARIRSEHSARGVLNSSATVARSWGAAVERATTTRDGLIDACFDVGVTNDTLIAAFVSEDLRHFLSSFMMSRFGHGNPSLARAVVTFQSNADALASRVTDEIRSRRFDFQKRTVGDSSVNDLSREKDQKFGILDAQNLFSKDVAAPSGIFGRVVIYLDIDDFKSVNTRFTERVVDRTILPSLQRLVQQSASVNGYAYAEGGDEMVIYLPNASVNMGLALADGLRQLIESHPFDVDGEPVKLTASFGVAGSRTCTGSDLADAANVAKRFAKSNGKNCVALDQPGGPSVVSRATAA